jgi:RNA polymerase sigma-70 factor (ECF subfamily)
MQAFAALIGKYQDRVYNVMLRMTGRTADAEELTQDAFLRALERISQFHGRSGFYTWLFRVAANLALSHRRRAARVKFHSLDAAACDGEAPSQADRLTAAMAERHAPSPAEAAVTTETQKRVVAALGELDDEFRLAVVLCDIEQMDYATAADVIGVPLGTIKSRLHRGRCLLRSRLAGVVGYDG